mgnify:CR=1 FL=1
MIDNLPVQTAQIYDYLSKGNFLCSNTSVKELRTLFSVVEDNFERLRDYFSHINFVLEQGNNYFYFSRKEPRATLEQKLQRFFAWIDIMDFFCTYDTAFGPGFHLLAGGDIGTFPYRHGSRDEAGRLKKHTGGKEKRKDILDTILDRMTKEGFIECVSDMNGTWKVLSSWDYLTKMIHSINIKNEDEISQ